MAEETKLKPLTKREKERLEELLKRQTAIAEAEKKQRKNDDNTCLRLFDLTVKQIRERLDKDRTNYDIEEAHKQYRDMLSKYKDMQAQHNELKAKYDELKAKYEDEYGEYEEPEYV